MSFNGIKSEHSPAGAQRRQRAYIEYRRTQLKFRRQDGCRRQAEIILHRECGAGNCQQAVCEEQADRGGDPPPSRIAVPNTSI